jgi:hypothetical protein
MLPGGIFLTVSLRLTQLYSRLTATNLKDGGTKRSAVHRPRRQHTPYSLSKQSSNQLYGMPRGLPSRRWSGSRTDPSCAIGRAYNVAVVAVVAVLRSCTNKHVFRSNVDLATIAVSHDMVRAS